MSPLRQQTRDQLRAALPRTATACVDAIVAEVPGYHRAFDARLRHNIERAVEQALTTFLELQDGERQPGFSTALAGARTLGQGEAASGRSTDALLTAYRVGARVAWQNFSAQALECHEDATAVASLAAHTFAFIDELSAASLVGHTEALTRRTRELARRRDQLASALADGENRSTLERLAENARWQVPKTLSALVVEGEPPPGLAESLLGDALWTPASAGPAVVFIPDIPTSRRGRIVTALKGSRASLGPAVPWASAAGSLRRAHRLLGLFDTAEPMDCDYFLPELLLDTDSHVAAELAARAVAPIATLTETKRELLAETLLAWLLHQGRRDEVAASLHVHPQTVRYRMNQLREHYGESLTEPRSVLELTLGLMAAHLNHEGHRR